MGDVILLGSGFSKALSDGMPCVSDLRADFKAFLRRQKNSEDILGESLVGWEEPEAVLGFLAADQPFLDLASNLERAAIFARAAEWLAGHIHEKQVEALKDKPPTWWKILFGKWHEERTSIISLNYDTLIEATVHVSDKTRDGVGVSNLYPLQFPSIASYHGASTVSESRVQTMSLIKLHGSLNWRHDPQNPAGPVYRERDVDHWQQETCSSWRQKNESAPGLMALIVPPTQSKSGYFDTTFIRTLWSLARDALRQAERLVVIGYSLPPYDLQVRSLLATAFAGKKVLVVNRNADVAAQAQRWFSDDIELRRIAGDDAVESFAHGSEGDAVPSGSAE